MKIIVTGAAGLIGEGFCQYMLNNSHEVKRIDLSLGHDLTDDKKNSNIFKDNNHYECLVNLFAINDHVEKKKNNDKNSLVDYDIEILRKFCEVNIVSLFNSCRNFIKYSNKPKSIVNISSLYGIRSPKHFIYETPKNIAYTTTKHAVIGMSKHLATYFANENIRINTIVPGGILHKQPDKFIEQYSSCTPMKRMMNKEELYPLIEFLSSDKASYITGSTYTIDGGWTAW